LDIENMSDSQTEANRIKTEINRIIAGIDDKKSEIAAMTRRLSELEKNKRKYEEYVQVNSLAEYSKQLEERPKTTAPPDSYAMRRLWDVYDILEYKYPLTMAPDKGAYAKKIQSWINGVFEYDDGFDGGIYGKQINHKITIIGAAPPSSSSSLSKSNAEIEMYLHDALQLHNAFNQPITLNVILTWQNQQRDCIYENQNSKRRGIVQSGGMGINEDGTPYMLIWYSKKWLSQVKNMR
jgi:hypothetical protein